MKELQILRELLELDSPSRCESAVAARIVAIAEEHGLTAWLDAVGNAHVDVGSGRPHLLLLGHMDTVPGSWPVVMDDQSISARGAVDAKGALATFLCVALRLANAAPCRITVVGAVEEETFGSRGARHVRNAYSPDAVVIGEPSGWDGITIGYMGATALEYVVSSPVAHGAAQQVPALELAVDFWQAVRAACHEKSQGKAAFYSWLPRLLELSKHGDGLSDEARLVLAIRTPPGIDADAVAELVDAVRKQGRCTYLESVAAVTGSKDDALSRALRVSIRKHGGNPIIKVKTGTSDMNVVAESWSVPMCAYGPGDAALDHTPDERLVLSEYLSSVEILTAGVRAWAATLDAPSERSLQ